MSPWTSNYLEVQYRAQDFYLALQEANFPHLSVNLRKFNFYKLAIARMKLECILAIYKKEAGWIKQKK